MLCEAAAYSTRFPSTMAAHSATRQAPTSLSLISEEGRSVLSRQGSLTPASPQLDPRARQPSGGRPGGQGSTIRRSLSLGSGLSGFLGNNSSKKALEENSLRRTASRGCLESLESGSNLKAMLDEMGDEDFYDRMEEEIEWGFKALESPQRSGRVMQKEPFAAPQFRAPGWQSFGKGGGPTPLELEWDRNSMFGEVRAKTKVTTLQSENAAPKRSIVMDQAQGALDSLKDRLESSLKMQPECSYSSAAAGSLCVPAKPASGASMKGVKAVRGLAREVDCLSLPTSLRRLKRRNSHAKNLNTLQPCAVQNAFTSMVYIIKAMHGHALETQQALYSDDLQNLMTPVHREMHLSFVWLFQQVFACTPEFMLSTMVLLANFSVHSLGENAALAAAVAMATTAEADSQIVKLSGLAPVADAADHGSVVRNLDSLLQIPSSPGGQDGSGHQERSASSVELNPQKDAILAGWSARQPPVPDAAKSTPSKLDRPAPAAEDLVLKAFMANSIKEMESTTGWRQPVQIDSEVAKKLVAPVHVTLSPDNYACFNRTDLEYQHAIDLQPTNVMLLANYAQFLYVVRHDNNRAEEYFHRAMQADPVDGEVLGRFASFLWLARGDKAAAERAFRAAAASDPTNPFHAGNYSHFLWHAGDLEESRCPAARPTGMA